MIPKILLILLISSILMIPTVFAEDEMTILFVNSSPSNYSSSLAYNTITTAIYSPVEQPAIITIYVQDEDMTPIGVLIFKTTLLAGTTPLEYGFTEPIKCAYNTYVHKPICNTDTPNTIYVNVFKDTNYSMPLAPEMTGVMMA